MKTFNEFTEEVMGTIKSYLPSEYQGEDVKLEEIRKNNNLTLHVISISIPNSRMAVNIHLEDMYEEYIQSGLPEIAIEGHVKKILQKSSNLKGLDLHYITDFESVKDCIHMQLINRESNQFRLSGIPHKDMEGTDMTAIFRVRLPELGEGASLTVQHDLLHSWNQTIEGLYEVSVKNMLAAEPVTMIRIEDMIVNGNFRDRRQGEEVLLSMQPYELYTITNNSQLLGASVLLYPDLLERIAQKSQSSFLLVPSSVHEWILCREVAGDETDKLHHMLISNNRSLLLPEEWLSDQVYRYDFSEKRLTMATSLERTKEVIEELGLQNGIIEDQDMILDEAFDMEP